MRGGELFFIVSDYYFSCFPVDSNVKEQQDEIQF